MNTSPSGAPLMTRRQLMQGGVKLALLAFVGRILAVLGLTGGVIATQVGCSVKNIAFYVSTVVGALQSLSPLLPGAAGIIAKAVTAANDFLKAYQAGKFDNAKTLLANLVDFMTQIANDVGINNPTVKGIFAIASVAIHVIATLLIGQIPPATMAARASDPAAATLHRLANPATIDAIFTATRP